MKLGLLMPQDTQLSQQMLNLYRGTAVVCVLAIIGLAPVLRQVVPDLQDPLLGRGLLLIAFLVYIGASFRSDWLRANMQPMLAVLIYLISGWLVLLNYLNDFHPSLAYAIFEMVVGGSIAFVTMRGLFTYLVAAVLGASSLMVANPNILTEPLSYLSSLVVVALLVFLVHYWRNYLQTQLEKTAVLMESVFQESADGLVLLRDEQVELVNEPAQRMLATAETDLIGELLGINLSGFDHLRDHPRDIQLALPDGSQLWAELVLTPVNETEQLELLRLTDISSRKRQEIELTNALRTTEKALNTRQEFLATVSHELRTPLNGIIGASRLLAQSAAERAADSLAHSDASSMDLLGVVQQSGDSLLSTIDEMIEFAEADTDVRDVRIEYFMLDDCVRLLEQKHASVAAEKGLSLTVEIDPSVAVHRFGDSERLRRALDILLNNALKFTTLGSISLSVSPVHPLTPDELCFSVADTGIGIDSSSQERIFDGFMQQEGADSRRFGGMGLGLALCRRLVGLLGGELTLTSEVGQGSVFEFVVHLPQAIQSASEFDSPPADQDIAILEKGESEEPARILLAEDNQINQMITLKMLEKLGYQADLAEDGHQVLAACERQNYALILMDVQMPNMGGVEATQTLRKQSATSQLPIIALTANAAASDRDRCKAAGMNEFLAKPVDLSTLKSTLDRFVAAVF